MSTPPRNPIVTTPGGSFVPNSPAGATYPMPAITVTPPSPPRRGTPVRNIPVYFPPYGSRAPASPRIDRPVRNVPEFVPPTSLNLDPSVKNWWDESPDTTPLFMKTRIYTPPSPSIDPDPVNATISTPTKQGASGMISPPISPIAGTSASPGYMTYLPADLQSLTDPSVSSYLQEMNSLNMESKNLLYQKWFTTDVLKASNYNCIMSELKILLVSHFGVAVDLSKEYSVTLLMRILDKKITSLNLELKRCRVRCSDPGTIHGTPQFTFQIEEHKKNIYKLLDLYERQMKIYRLSEKRLLKSVYRLKREIDDLTKRLVRCELREGSRVVNKYGKIVPAPGLCTSGNCDEAMCVSQLDRSYDSALASDLTIEREMAERLVNELGESRRQLVESEEGCLENISRFSQRAQLLKNLEDRLFAMFRHRLVGAAGPLTYSMEVVATDVNNLVSQWVNSVNMAMEQRGRDVEQAATNLCEKQQVCALLKQEQDYLKMLEINLLDEVSLVKDLTDLDEFQTEVRTEQLTENRKSLDYLDMEAEALKTSLYQKEITVEQLQQVIAGLDAQIDAVDLSGGEHDSASEMAQSAIEEQNQSPIQLTKEQRQPAIAFDLSTSPEELSSIEYSSGSFSFGSYPTPPIFKGLKFPETPPGHTPETGLILNKELLAAKKANKKARRKEAEARRREAEVRQKKAALEARRKVAEARWIQEKEAHAKRLMGNKQLTMPWPKVINEGYVASPYKIKLDYENMLHGFLNHLLCDPERPRMKEASIVFAKKELTRYYEKNLYPITSDELERDFQRLHDAARKGLRPQGYVTSPEVSPVNYYEKYYVPPREPTPPPPIRVRKRTPPPLIRVQEPTPVTPEPQVPRRQRRYRLEPGPTIPPFSPIRTYLSSREVSPNAYPRQTRISSREATPEPRTPFQRRNRQRRYILQPDTAMTPFSPQRTYLSSREVSPSAYPGKLYIPDREATPGQGLQYIQLPKLPVVVKPRLRSAPNEKILTAAYLEYELEQVKRQQPSLRFASNEEILAAAFRQKELERIKRQQAEEIARHTPDMQKYVERRRMFNQRQRQMAYEYRMRLENEERRRQPKQQTEQYEFERLPEVGSGSYDLSLSISDATESEEEEESPSFTRYAELTKKASPNVSGMKAIEWTPEENEPQPSTSTYKQEVIYDPRTRVKQPAPPAGGTARQPPIERGRTRQDRRMKVNQKVSRKLFASPHEESYIEVLDGGTTEQDGDPVISKSFVLHSPERQDTVTVNIDVAPKPLVSTASGEHFQCDVTMDMIPGAKAALPAVYGPGVASTSQQAGLHPGGLMTLKVSDIKPKVHRRREFQGELPQQTMFSPIYGDPNIGIQTPFVSPNSLPQEWSNSVVGGSYSRTPEGFDDKFRPRFA